MDGDAIRAQLPRPLGFSKADRDEHAAAGVNSPRTMNDKGTICIVAAITPYAQTREHTAALSAVMWRFFATVR